MRGTRVVDLTRVLAGPFATMQLADHGADVIKVEPPEGDETRGFGPRVADTSTYFLANNRGKRSIVLDLKTEAGRAVLAALLRDADVLVENFRPGVLERLGFGWPELHRANPRLVVVAIHAFGDEQPEWRGRPGYDLVLQAMGGAMAATGRPGDPPTKTATSIADLVAGLYAVQAVLLGLLERERTGSGRKLVVNMLQAQATCLAYHATRWTVAGQLEQQRGSGHAGLVPYDVFRCEDGWLAVACGNDSIWRRLVGALELPDRPEWRRNVDRVAARADVDAAVGARLAGWTVDAADRALADAGVPAGPVLTLDRTLGHPAVTMWRTEHPTLGEIPVPAPAIRTDTTGPSRGAPALGADRDDVLAGLGYDASTIEALAAAGAFGARS